MCLRFCISYNNTACCSLNGILFSLFDSEIAGKSGISKVIGAARETAKFANDFRADRVLRDQLLSVRKSPADPNLRPRLKSRWVANRIRSTTIRHAAAYVGCYFRVIESCFVFLCDVFLENVHVIFRKDPVEWCAAQYYPMCTPAAVERLLLAALVSQKKEKSPLGQRRIPSVTCVPRSGNANPS